MVSAARKTGLCYGRKIARESGAPHPARTLSLRHARVAAAVARASTTATALRALALGMLFVTHTLALPAPAHPGRRGAQRPGPAPELVVPLGGDAEAEALRREVEGEGVGTRYCRVWAGRGVLGAWALQHGASNRERVGREVADRKQRTARRRR
jgi:hypothetical protein